MPTPVSVARQCLTAEAARALEDAAAAARRRGHPQTTSLHAVAALLAGSAAAPVLRDACARARSAAFSHRLQLRALELCFSAALDRLPSSPARPPDDAPPPPVSNSLMAAVKRSQAIQRRSAGHYHQPPLAEPASASPASPAPVVKVELRQLVLSILDDPVVSRVFADAGFGSADVKLAVLRPGFGSDARHSRPRIPPLFLCNFGAGADGLLDDSLWRVAEVLTRRPRRNPLLVGAAAREAVAGFRKWVDSPSFTPELAGLRLVSVGSESAAGSLRPMSAELREMAGGGGLLVDVGDLEDFPADGRGEEMVEELSRLLDVEMSHGRVWVVGWASSYDVYMRFVDRYEVVDKEWDLQLLPINSVQQRPSSLMESFVPFGGSFPELSDIKFSFRGVPISRCRICDEKYEQEVLALVKGFSPQAGLPFWNRKTDLLSMYIEQDAAKANNCILFTRIIVLQKKWNEICLHHHQNNQFLEPNAYLMAPTVLPFKNGGFSRLANEERKVDNQMNNILASCQSKSELANQKLMPSLGAENLSTEEGIKCLGEDCSKEDSDSSSCKYLSLTASKNCTSSSSVTTVNTDLMLGACCSPLMAYQKECMEGLDDCTLLSSSEFYSNSMLKHPSALNSGLSSHRSQYQDFMDVSKKSTSCSQEFKSLWRSLKERVGRQQAALCAISQTITHFKSGKMRRRGTSMKGDIWLCLVGPDRSGKKRVANALAELMCGSPDKLIHVDLNSQQSGNDVWRQTVIGHIVKEISKKPLSVVFLENVDRADLVLQNNLTWAVETGKFKDSCGRQVGLSNTIFITTVEGGEGHNVNPEKLGLNFTEKRVLAAQMWQMQVLISCSSELNGTKCLNLLDAAKTESVIVTNHLSRAGRKRKLEEVHKIHEIPKLSLDLNVSAEELEGSSNEDENEDSRAWLEDFFNMIDQRVEFEPFNFDALANDLLRVIKSNFRKSFGSKGSLEIESRCMEQMLAAAWACDATDDVKVWIDKVLGRSFAEAQERYRSPHVPQLKLVACEKFCTQEERFPGIPLPARIVPILDV